LTTVKFIAYHHLFLFVLEVVFVSSSEADQVASAFLYCLAPAPMPRSTGRASAVKAINVAFPMKSPSVNDLKSG
jgi:hypothetical protein